MKQFWICTYGKRAELVLAADETEAGTLATPLFEGFPPDAVFDVTDGMVGVASNLIQTARDRVGEGADSRFRYDVTTLVAIWRGQAPPDIWQERYAREFQTRRRVEAELTEKEATIAELRVQLAAAPASATPTVL